MIYRRGVYRIGGQSRYKQKTNECNFEGEKRKRDFVKKKT